MYAAIAVLGVVFFYFMQPETKNSSLENLEETED